MRDQIAETLVGAVVLLIAGVFLTYSLSAAGRTAGGGYDLSVRFASVEGLAVGSDVRVSGVKVGAVSAIRLNPDTYDAEVSFTVAEGVMVPTDSSIRLKNEGLLGGVYLSLEPGGEEEYLTAGDEIEYGQGAIDVLRLLADFVRGSRNDGDIE